MTMRTLTSITRNWILEDLVYLDTMFGSDVGGLLANTPIRFVFV
jgi:hypothetical protein